jgi:hypothetical protein
VLTAQIGPDATQQLIHVPLDAIPALNRHVDAARQLHHTLQDRDDLVDNRSVDLLIGMRSNEIRMMTQALALIAQWNLPLLRLLRRICGRFSGPWLIQPWFGFCICC